MYGSRMVILGSSEIELCQYVEYCEGSRAMNNLRIGSENGFNDLEFEVDASSIHSSSKS